MASINPAEVSAILKDELAKAGGQVEAREEGIVLEIGDGIAQVYGLSQARLGEIIRFENGTEAIALNLDPSSVGVVFMGPYEGIIEGSKAYRTGRVSSILVGEGAERFAREMGMEPTDMENLITAAARRRWEEDRALREPTGHDTIGMVAIDEKGSMAVATSTSGASLKTPGRVGDSPIIGSGFYVETGVGGAAGTGLGEDIMRTCCAFRCVQLMGMGFSPRTAVETVVRTAHETIRRHGGTPDCIALVCMNARGECAGAANHKGFSYAVSDSTGKLDVIFVDPVVDKDGEEEAQR